MAPFVLVSIGAGLLSAVLYGSAASGIGLSIIPMYLSPLPLFLIGLSYGGIAALIGGLSATAALALIGGPLLAIAFFLSNAAAPVLLSHVANWSRTFVDQSGQSVTEYYPAGRMFVWLSGLGIAIALVLTLYLHFSEGGLAAWVPSVIEIKVLTDAIIQAQIQSGVVPTDESVLQQRLIRLALPGLALFWALISIGNGALAQRIAVRFGRNLRPSPELLTMELPRFMLVPLVGGALLAFLPGDFGFFGSVMVTLAAVPYFFLGLATVHVISHRLPGRAFALSGVYILLVVLGWPSLLIVGIGIVEHFANLRLTYGVVKP